MHFDYSGLPDRPQLRTAFADGLAMCRLQARRRLAEDPRRDSTAEGLSLFICGPLCMARVLDETVPGASDALLAAALQLPWWKDPLAARPGAAAHEDAPRLGRRDMSRLTVAAAYAALQDLASHPARYSGEDRAERLAVLEDRFAACAGSDDALDRRFLALADSLRAPAAVAPPATARRARPQPAYA